ncbi:hypothetical protein GOP47_0025642 [Adiantum capillus-veneris]|uniref:LOB domain-containing protein n=1 Tax=Adiantum capillus-veneris TaxID=13818 RepID=A0A9D4U0X2_ADICA|nr:hypothetical protein GOP47_0025642 [Adiantum capillus-veneris]
MTGNTSTPQACAACKFQRRKCSPECPLAPYFPADQPKQFLNVHKLYGVSNTLRILKQVDPLKRNDAMKSILYEADARDRDPVHGCFGIISLLQSQAEMLREELEYVRTQTHLLEQQQTLTYYNQQQQQLHSFSNHLTTMSTTTTVENLANGMNNQGWPVQQMITPVSAASPNAVAAPPSWLYQYMATSPHMQSQLDTVCMNSNISPSSCNAGCLVTSNKPGAMQLVDVKPSFDTRVLVDFEPHQNSFHDSAPKTEAYESSGESSIKDPQSLEHDELESAAALFTLTSGHTS